MIMDEDSVVENKKEDERLAAVDEDLESRGIRAAVAFLILFVGIGIPIWWKSTEVYRVSLPYTEIDDLKQFNIEHKVTINVIISNLNVRPELEKSLQPLMKAGIGYKILVRLYTNDEWKQVEETDSVDALMTSLWAQPQNRRTGKPEVGSINVWELPYNSTIIDEDVHVRTSRNVLFKGQKALESNSLLETLRWMSGEVELKKAMSPEKQARRRVKGHPSFNLVFTLLNPESSNLDWAFTKSIKMYVEPFTDKLKSVANLSVMGRVLYNRPVGDELVHRLEGRGYSVIEEDHLPHLINPAESWLGSYVSDDPSLYFIVYIPKKDDGPVYIRGRDGSLSSHNAFLSPGWGGFLIYNPEEGQTELEMEKVFTVFLTQLRLLLGLPDPLEQSDVGHQTLDETALTDWEVDFLVRLFTVDFVLSARQSLESLSALLAEIRNMVILDEVGGAVYSAVISLQWAQESMQEGDLQGTFVASRRAFKTAEEAFFHPSMLALLYFPDDQKYAVYVPLFLPVGFPVLMSLKKVLQWYRKKKGKSKEKEE